MQDEIHWQADRAKLRFLWLERPEWTQGQLAQAINRSLSWVKKWLRRFKQVALDNQRVLLGLSHCRHNLTTPKVVAPLLVERILSTRDHPPANLKRVPGPRTLIYFLQKDAVLAEAGIKVPNSTSFVWRVLSKNGRIAHPHATKKHKLRPRPAPFTSWQVDFKDVATVEVAPDGKQAHLVEVLNVVDEGTSILVEAIARDDFNAETALAAMIEVVKIHGLPEQITFDRDPRWVGSHSGRDFPSAFVKFWHCLGVKVNLCPPHRPDLNCYVERYHRAFGQECLAIHRPANLAEVLEVTAQYKTHYNYERPHQGKSCNNRPPREAFPDLPVLPTVPAIVKADKWLERCVGWRFVRKVDKKGSFKLDRFHYYLSKELAGKYVSLELDPASGEIMVRQEQTLVRRLKLKGLMREALRFEEYVRQIVREARSERRLAALRRRARQGIQHE